MKGEYVLHNGSHDASLPDLATFTQVSESSGKETALNAERQTFGLIKSFWVGTGQAWSGRCLKFQNQCCDGTSAGGDVREC